MVFKPNAFRIASPGGGDGHWLLRHNALTSSGPVVQGCSWARGAPWHRDAHAGRSQLEAADASSIVPLAKHPPPGDPVFPVSAQGCSGSLGSGRGSQAVVNGSICTKPSQLWSGHKRLPSWSPHGQSPSDTRSLFFSGIGWRGRERTERPRQSLGKH